MARLVKAEEWTPRGIESLEPNALEVVRGGASRCVVAGPGTGKTELLAQRASFLLECGICRPPQRILAISFKRDAAKNLRERVSKRSGAAFAGRFDSFTFDAFAKGVVDQFRTALPESLRPTSEYDVLVKLDQGDVEEIMRSMSPPSTFGSKRDLMGLATKKFFDYQVPRAPIGTSEPVNLEEWAARQFWYELLRGSGRSKLSFAMIMRLAGHLLENDLRLSRAYRVAYSHAFLDEFQDTTAIQYWLTKILFKGTSAILTAVGDPHQQIMIWAGAIKNIFEKFEADFGAAQTKLLRNHRASSELAPLVRFLAEQMHASLSAGASIPPIEPGDGPPASACSAHMFDDEDGEAAWIASEIASLVANGTNPRAVGILVRMKASEYSRQVIPALRRLGVLARVEDALQDLLTEPAVQWCILGMRALVSSTPGKHWSEFRSLLGEARGFELDDKRWPQLERDLARVGAGLREQFATPGVDARRLREGIRESLDLLLVPVRAQSPQYVRGSFYDDCLNGFCEAVVAGAHDGSWDTALDLVEGVGTVPVLTIHKSKGLEYDAVFFVGLEDGAFWNFRRAPDEEMNAFYVAVSRARRRLAFTLAFVRARNGKKDVQSTDGISKIYDLMEKAGVAIESHRN